MPIDELGRLISVSLNCQGKEIRITNVYAPNSPSNNFFRDLAAWLTNMPQSYHLLGGGFICVMCEAEDRWHPLQEHTPNNNSRRDSQSSAHTMPLYMLSEAICLTDLWHITHPLDREYTYVASTHDCMSRVDYILGTDPIILMMASSNIYDIQTTDHALISVSLQNAIPKPKAIMWRFPQYLVQPH